MRLGLVSTGAVHRVSPGRASNYDDTSMGPVGSISSGHIDADAQQRTGAAFRGQADYGPAQTGADQINQSINRRQYGYRLKGKDPFRKSSWKPQWFDRGLMGKLGDRSRDPASDVGGPGIAQSALERARLGGA
jgi:hypothetical protein